MNLRLHTVVAEILLQLVAAGRKHRENMPDTIPVSLWHTDEWILHLINIECGDFLATGIIVIEVRKFRFENRSLQFIDAGVAALIVKDVFARTAVIAQCTDDSSQFLIVRCHGSCISEGT